MKANKTIDRKSTLHAIFGLSMVLLVGCGTDSDTPDLQDTNEPSSPAPANPIQNFQSTSNPLYTAQVLSDGSVVLEWPKDPEATGYAIYRDDTLVAEVPSDSLSFTDSAQLLDDAQQINAAGRNFQKGRKLSYKVFSISQEKKQRIWVDQLEVNISTQSEPPTASTEESPDQSPILEAANPSLPPIPAVIVPTATVDPDPVNPDPVDPDPVNPDPVDPDPVNPDPVDPDPNNPDLVDPDPVNPDPVDPDPNNPDPVDPDPVNPDPVDPDPNNPDPEDTEPNLFPRIDSISLGCDIVLEAIAIEVGVATTFTLFVDDESPLTLSYSATSDDTSVANVSVDNNGVFTVNGNIAGNTTLSLIVTDDQGLKDQLLLSVVSEI